jgi:MFS family permease
MASLLMDTSSELVHALLPVFLTVTLGASVFMVGVIEGVAEATASVVKVFSGLLSDRIGRRKPLVLLGYGLATVTKPLFPLASGLGMVVTARFVDRVGKGIRGAPRDALIADVTPAGQRGAAYGLRQGLDSVGAFVGPLLALLLMILLAGDIRAVLWLAAVPAVLCVASILLFVREPAAAVATRSRGLGLKGAALRSLPRRFWIVVAFAGVLTLARFSEAFLVLRAQGVGVPATWVPLVMVVMNVVYAVGAAPAGAAADRFSRRALLFLGLTPLLAADVVLAAASTPGLVFVGAGLWGLHMALTQGLLSALVADAAPEQLRGTAFGIFHLASGLFLLLASTLAGLLWSVAGPGATFVAGAAFTGIAAIGLLLAPRRASVPP